MLPKPIIAVVESARRVVAIRKDLAAARKSGEVNEVGLERRAKALRKALDALSVDVAVVEKQIEDAKLRRKGSALPWAGLLKAATEFMAMANKIKSTGKVDGATAAEASRWAARHGVGGTRPKDEDIVDGELVE